MPWHLPGFLLTSVSIFLECQKETECSALKYQTFNPNKNIFTAGLLKPVPRRERAKYFPSEILMRFCESGPVWWSAGGGEKKVWTRAFAISWHDTVNCNTLWHHLCITESFCLISCDINDSISRHPNTILRQADNWTVMILAINSLYRVYTEGTIKQTRVLVKLGEEFSQL